MTQDREFIKVWYTGERKPVRVPIKTFQVEALNFWSYVPPNVPIPQWVREGVDFDFRGIYLLTSNAKTEVTHGLKIQSWNTEKHVLHGLLRIRSIRQGFASCLDSMGRLIIISLAEIAQNGDLKPTVWTMLLQDAYDEDDLWA